MAQPPVFISRLIPESDTMIPTKPFAQATHPLLRGIPEKPAPERPKTNADLFYEDRCDTCTDILFKNTSSPQQKIRAAKELCSILAKIEDPKRLSDSKYMLRETMLDESEPLALRAECANALAMCGRMDTVIGLAELLRNGHGSVQSQLLAVRALSLQRGDYALDALMDVVEVRGHPDVRFAAAMELASMAIPRARQAAEYFITAERFSEEAIRVREALSGSAAN